MAHLNVALLPSLAATLDGRPVVQFRSARTRALLALLAAERGAAHTRGRLAGMLWPDEPEATALRNLSQTLLQLRQALDDTADQPLILVSRHTIQLNPAACSANVADLDAHLAAARGHAAAGDRAACAAELERAVALYRGPFLADSALRVSDLFEEWTLLVRERVHRQVIAALGALVDSCLEGGDDQGAERHARRLLELDPLHEAAHRRLMGVLALAGQTTAALAQYEACRRILAAELDVAPSAETTALYEQIRAGRPGAPRPGAADGDLSAAEVPDHGSLYGRAAELGTLRRWLADERCRVVMLLGMGGVGKTALAARVAAAAAGGFERVVWRSLHNAPPLEETLRECAQALAAQGHTRLPESLDARLDLLLALLRERRCLLVLDNLESILEAGERAGTYRPGYEDYGQLLERAGSRRHASCLLLTSRERPQGLARLEGAAGSVRALPLAGLDPEAGAAILRERGLAESGARLAQVVERYSGNPLALALVSAAIRDMFGGDIAAFLRDEAPIFGDVRDVLDQQWLRLPPLERELLLWLAIAREPSTLSDLHASLVAAPSLAAILEALHSLQHRSLISSHDGTFALQNVIVEYLTDRLVEQVVAELTGEAPADLMRHALIQARAKEYVRQMQARLILAPVARRLRARLGGPGADALLRRLLQRLRAAPRSPGYAAGTILNLLPELGVDPSGYDFSQLCVWQAYARGVALPGVNFAHADLTGSVFTDSFRSMHAVAWSPDGARLATAAGDGTLLVWRATDGVLLSASPVSRGFLWTIDWHPAGDLVACGGDEAAVTIWDVARGLVAHTLPGHGGWINDLAFSPDGVLLATCGGDRSVRIWHVPTWRLVHTLDGHADIVECLAWSGDGTRLASAAIDQTVRLWDSRDGRLLHTLPSPTPRLRSLAWRPGGSQLAASAPGCPLHLWDADTGELLQTLNGAGFGELAWSPDGRRLAVAGADQSLSLWDAETREMALAVPHPDVSGNLAWSPGGTMLAVPCSDSTVRLWDGRTGRTLATFYGHTAWIYSVAWSPDGALVAAGTHAQQIQLWDARTGRAARTLSGHAGWVLSVAWSPDGRRIASGGRDRAVRTWDAVSGRPLAVVGRHAGAVESVAWSPDGRRIASGGRDRAVRVWESGAGLPLHTLDDHRDIVLCVAWSPDGALLASGGRDRTVRVWDLAAGRERWRLEGHRDVVTSVTWSPDGRRLASASNDGTLRVWRLDGGEATQTLRGHSGQIKAVAWRPDGGALASGGNDLTVRVWDAATGACLRTLDGHSQWVKSIAWSPDGVHLVTGGYDETARLWRPDTGDCAAVLRPSGPYAGTNITGATGLTGAQRQALIALGAVEDLASSAMSIGGLGVGECQ